MRNSLDPNLMKTKHWALLVIFACSCPKTKNGPDPLPVKEGDCEKAEANLINLKCKDSKGNLVGGPTSTGKKYSEFCKEKMSQGYNINPACLAVISKCEERESCR